MVEEGSVINWHGNRAERAIHGGLEVNLRAACEFLTNDIKRAFPDLRVFGATGERSHSKPGEIPYVQLSNLRRAISWIVKRKFLIGEMHGHVGVLKEKANQGDPSTQIAKEYALPLEVGTARMAARPFLRPAIARNRAKLKQLLCRRIVAP